jgi:ribosomal protein L16 Arg81 hydroxylase
MATAIKVARSMRASMKTGRQRGRRDLAWLLDPVTPRQFFAEYWERKPLILHRQQADYYRQLLSLDDVDRVLTTFDRKHPDVTLKDARRELTSDDYTTDGETLDVARLYDLFAGGATITLAFLDTVWPPLDEFCRQLESDWNCPFQTNIYLTPPAAQGAKPHYDTHDVFVLQLEGSKRWTLFGRPVETPLAGQEFDPKSHPLGPVTQEFELRAGDVAYVPRGVAHEARSTSEISLHITTGALRYTWTDLLLEFVAAASLGDPELRRSLPPDFASADFDRSTLGATMRNLLARVVKSGKLDAAMDTIVENFIASRREPLRGQLAEVASLPQLRSGSCVQARPGVQFRLRSEADALLIEAGARTIRFPAHARAAVERALSGEPVQVHELAGLDAEGQLTLARRLIREGLLQQASPEKSD